MLRLCGIVQACARAPEPKLVESSPNVPGSRDAAPSPCSRGLGTWVWKKESVLDAGEREELVQFARVRGVSTLYLADAAEFLAAPGFDGLADLVGRAHRFHADVAWVNGDPSWALDAHHGTALGLIERASRASERAPCQRQPSLPADWWRAVRCRAVFAR